MVLRPFTLLLSVGASNTCLLCLILQLNLLLLLTEHIDVPLQLLVEIVANRCFVSNCDSVREPTSFRLLFQLLKLFLFLAYACWSILTHLQVF